MHQKHPKMTRPALGHYGRTEFALVGTTCERMERLMAEWAARFAEYRCLTVTGEHRDHPTPASIRYGRKHFTPGMDDWNEYDDRLLGQDYDLVLVNGNHYPAKRQIVFVDEAKAATLERRKEQLTDIFAIVHVNGPAAMPEWLKTLASQQHCPPITTTMSLLEPLADGIGRALKSGVPRLRALILAGGASSRMGEDKGQLVYRNGQTEVERLYHLCLSCGVAASISVREGTDAEAYPAPVIPDRFLGMGPAGAICSAFLEDPDAAWLVLACDLPLLDTDTLRQLIDARAPERYATAVRGPEREWPEPLIAIYEPRAYQRLLRFLTLGYSCPRKLLINSSIQLVNLDDMLPLTNANTPEERDRVRSIFR
ncbi:molybdenum cofactor guanylyltransferase [Neolewinella xylanilytica]|uniref:Molybdenum cofactor guanylyltransferase n=1 Tax=Neolewinella xylanilytica TaxID=1514080 RepID=A0A2S6IA70_9BACT|nr:NTP transferase domain-containing protein [Neolewinella xylanilytica]PPK88386.1 molybdenum cofactor guanylyltransferase [Neolewinella xylanilytica]